ncbi:hypothetical protein DFJ63DRAFT_310064 [Scheffersomyces coipomensis]|uniref:uncharacterized protein n=1 Tax=Scheffersomyces coipomensis TaxID=1788519 RepID=UPI00315DB6F8
MSSTMYQVPLTVLPFNPEDGNKFMAGNDFGSHTTATSNTARSSTSSASSTGTTQSLYKTISPTAAASLSSTSSTSDFTDLKGDLLPDLWQTASLDSPQNQLVNSHLINQAHQIAVNNNWSQNFNNQSYSSLPSHAQQQHHQHQHQNYTTVQAPIGYAQQLTEENLIFNSDVDSNDGSRTSPPAHIIPSYNSPVYYMDDQNNNINQNINNDDIFNFEKQQLLLQSNGVMFDSNHRNGSTSSTSSLDDSRKFGFSSKMNQPSVNTQLYKTELCASFMKMGICPYGNKCQFAHGENELKNVDRPPKWRSKACANWTKFGSCRYGNRCCFKHGCE